MTQRKNGISPFPFTGPDRAEIVVKALKYYLGGDEDEFPEFSQVEELTEEEEAQVAEFVRRYETRKERIQFSGLKPLEAISG